VTLKEIDDWNCCGGAAAHSVSHLLGLALPARNVAKAQAAALPLAIPCPGCFNAVRRAQNALENDPKTGALLEEIVGFKYDGKLEVKAIHQILEEAVGLDKLKDSIKRPLAGLRVVSYYGCALVRDPEIVKMGDHENPMFMDDVVTAMGGEAVDWSYKVDCCGADLAMTHGKIAKNIADKIAGMALEAKADCIMTACGLCQVNLDMKQTGANRAKLPVMYFSELLGLAMGVGNRKMWWSKHIVSPKNMLKEKGLL